MSLTNDLHLSGDMANRVVNDTVFANSHVGRQGGTAFIGSGNQSSQVEFHRCTVTNSTTGTEAGDDQPGGGGAFSVDKGVTLVVSDCDFKDNSSRNKVNVYARYGMGRTFESTFSVDPHRGSSKPSSPNDRRLPEILYGEPNTKWLG